MDMLVDINDAAEYDDKTNQNFWLNIDDVDNIEWDFKVHWYVMRCYVDALRRFQ
jgi:hypothetical protein